MILKIKSQTHLEHCESISSVLSLLTVKNPKYTNLKRLNKPTRKTPQHLKFYNQEENNTVFTIPRGASEEVYLTCKAAGENIQVVDDRLTLSNVAMEFKGVLRPFQEDATVKMLKASHGCLEASTGSGKTVMALYIITQRRQPALIIVHTRELLYQWVARVGQFIGIPEKDVGIIGDGKKRIGDKITIGMVQTLSKGPEEYAKCFGHLVVDECHRAPSTTFASVVSAFPAKFLLGLTATPYRRDGLGKVICFFLGEIKHRVQKGNLLDRGLLCDATVRWRETNFNTCRDASAEYSKVLSELTKDSDRNKLICRDVAMDSCNGLRLIVSDRKEHCRELKRILKLSYNIDSGLLVGGLSIKARDRVRECIRNKSVGVLICTGQLIGEGYDLPELETLFLTTPIKFSGRLIQYIGRILRPSPGKGTAVIYDYVDKKVGVLRASARARLNTYAEQQIQTDGGI